MALIDSYKITYDLLRDFIEKEEKEKITEAIAKDLAEIFAKGGKALIAGNGGSNCDALHFAEEFTGRFRGNRKALPAIAISDSSHITCVGNDFGFDYIFSRGVEAYGKEGDLFIKLLDFLFFGLIAGWAALAAEKTVPQRSEGVT